MKPFALLFASALAFSCATPKPLTPIPLSTQEIDFYAVAGYVSWLSDNPNATNKFKDLPSHIACITDPTGKTWGVYYSLSLPKGESKVRLGAFQKNAVFIGRGILPSVNKQGQLFCQSQLLLEALFANTWQKPFRSKVALPINAPDNNRAAILAAAPFPLLQAPLSKETKLFKYAPPPIKAGKLLQFFVSRELPVSFLTDPDFQTITFPLSVGCIKDRKGVLHAAYVHYATILSEEQMAQWKPDGVTDKGWHFTRIGSGELAIPTDDGLYSCGGRVMTKDDFVNLQEMPTAFLQDFPLN